MRILKENTIGIFIDIQEKLFPHMQEMDQLEQNLITLAAGFKVLEIPFLVTEQYPKGLGFTILPLKMSIGDYSAIEKMAFSCCDEPQFANILSTTGRKNVILCGIETHVCVLQTALDLLQSGYQPVVIEDCVSSRKLSDKLTAIERMRQEGAIITSLESILFELTRNSGTETFKAISKLVK
ncbi:MAG: hydrolase [Bacteroidales bacterium]|nr:hydrolase [Bacteroidales bacterium]